MLQIYSTQIDAVLNMFVDKLYDIGGRDIINNTDVYKETGTAYLGFMGALLIIRSHIGNLFQFRCFTVIFHETSELTCYNTLNNILFVHPI